jgi:hypothetical protein
MWLGLKSLTILAALLYLASAIFLRATRSEEVEPEAEERSLVLQSQD